MTVSVQGAELYYATRGTGPACLVPSAIGTEPYKRLTPPQLSDHLRLVYVGLRTHRSDLRPSRGRPGGHLRSPGHDR